jgi:hypothetical protein
MVASNYSLLSAFIFTLVAVLQLVRALNGWPVTGRHDFNSITGKLGSLRCCRDPCVAWICGVSGLRNRVSAPLRACRGSPCHVSD